MGVHFFCIWAWVFSGIRHWCIGRVLGVGVLFFVVFGVFLVTCVLWACWVCRFSHFTMGVFMVVSMGVLFAGVGLSVVKELNDYFCYLRSAYNRIFCSLPRFLL